MLLPRMLFIRHVLRQKIAILLQPRFYFSICRPSRTASVRTIPHNHARHPAAIRKFVLLVRGLPAVPRL